MQTLSALLLCTLVISTSGVLLRARRTSGHLLEVAALRRGMRQPAAPL